MCEYFCLFARVSSLVSFLPLPSHLASLSLSFLVTLERGRQKAHSVDLLAAIASDTRNKFREARAYYIHVYMRFIWMTCACVCVFASE